MSKITTSRAFALTALALINCSCRAMEAPSSTLETSESSGNALTFNLRPLKLTYDQEVLAQGYLSKFFSENKINDEAEIWMLTNMIFAGLNFPEDAEKAIDLLRSLGGK